MRDWGKEAMNRRAHQREIRDLQASILAEQLEKKPRKLECSVCGDWASKIADGKPVCSNCAEVAA